ncbi:retrovirus-related pol polyprotein from transposon TNT 1-94 [Tanacetum coccineum]
MFEDLEYVQSLEKEVDELEFEKAEFSNEYDLLLQECVSKDIMCSVIHSLADIYEQTELQCSYLEKIKECESLTIELSKQTENVSRAVYIELLRSFAKLEKHSISLELVVQQCQEQLKNDKGNDLPTGNRRSDLYIISLQETSSPTPTCFMENASPTQAWLWHRRLSHLNFDTINLLSKKDIENGLPNLNYVKD